MGGAREALMSAAGPSGGRSAPKPSARSGQMRARYAREASTDATCAAGATAARDVTPSPPISPPMGSCTCRHAALPGATIDGPRRSRESMQFEIRTTGEKKVGKRASPGAARLSKSEPTAWFGVLRAKPDSISFPAPTGCSASFLRAARPGARVCVRSAVGARERCSRAARAWLLPQGGELSMLPVPTLPREPAV